MGRLLSVFVCIFCIGIAAPAGAAEPLEGSNLGPRPDFEYIEMRPLVLPVITERGLMQQVSLVISLEVPYGGTEPVKALMPKLADAYISDLYGALGVGQGLMKDGAVNMPAIHKRLTKNTIRVMGPDKVHSVLLQAVQQTPVF